MKTILIKKKDKMKMSISILEVLQASQINFENMMKLHPGSADNPHFRIAKVQMDNALNALLKHNRKLEDAYEDWYAKETE